MQTAFSYRYRRERFCCDGRGFTILEMMITMAVLLVLSALAIPTMQAVRSARLHQAGADYASFLQNARIEAIQKDSYYSVIPQAGPPASVFLDLQGNGVFATGDPIIVLPSSVYVRGYGSNPPALANLESVSLASSNDLSLDVTDNPTFGPRGLPCKPISSGGYTTCPAFSGTVSGTSFITFLQSEPDSTWLAVVVNPSARVRVFKYSSGTWSPVQ